MSDAWAVLLVVGVVAVLSAGLYYHLKVDTGRMSPWPPIIVLAVLGLGWLVLHAVT